MNVEVGVDTRGDAQWHRGHGHPFRVSGWGGTTPEGTTDRTATGLLDRLLVGHSARPVGVGWVSKLGRRIIRRTIPRGTSAGRCGSDRAGAPTLTLMSPPLELVDRQRPVLILAAGPIAERVVRRVFPRNFLISC